MKTVNIKTTLVAAALCSAASLPAFAIDATPFFSVYGGAGSWTTESGGELGDSNTNIDELNLSDEDNMYFYAAFEHPVPLVPNVRLEYIDISTSGSGQVNSVFDFGGQQFDESVPIDTTLELTFLDAVLYYEIAMIDFGVTFRQFDAEVTATGLDPSTGETVTETESEDGILPMLYVQTQIDLPFTGLYVTGSLNGLSIGDVSIVDYRGAVGYGIELGPLATVGAEIGYRSFELDVDDDDSFQGNIELSGIYVGVNVKF